VKPFEISSEIWVHQKIRSSNRIRIQEKEILVLATSLAITSQVEEVRDSPSPELPKEPKGKEPQEETMIK
jgi:hypothetical protein